MSTVDKEAALKALHDAEAALAAAEAVVEADVKVEATGTPAKFLHVEGALGPTAINGG